MILYLSIILFPCFFYFFIKKEKIFNTLFISFIFFILLFVALRTNIGPDQLTQFYQINEKTLTFSDVIFYREPFHLILQIIIQKAGLQYDFVKLIYSFFSILILLSLISKSENYNKLIYLIFLIPFFIFFLNINSPRQSFSICLITSLLFQNFFFNKKLFWKLFLIYISVSTHNSAIVLLPLFIILIYFDNLTFIKKLSSKQILYFFIFLLFILIISFGLISKVWSYFYSNYLFGVNYNSSASYFRSFYFAIFILFGLTLLFNFKLNNQKNFIIIFFSILFFINYLFSFYNTTTSDRFNFFLFSYSFWITYNYRYILEKYFIKIIDLFLLVLNIFFFTLWINFSPIFKDTWVPYDNILFKIF